MEIQVASQANYVLSNPTTRTVDYSYTIRNPGPNDVKNAVLNIATPVSDEGQLVLSLDWASPPNRYFTDPFGTRVASFDIGTIRRDTTVVVGFTAQVQLWSIAYVIDPDVVGTVRDTPLEISNLYTIDGSYYAISDSLVISTAQAVVGSETNPYLMAIQIHDYVATTLDYVFDNVRDPVPEVLRRGSGSCSEFSFAFIALARASGLAARFAHAWATGEHATHSHELEATDSVEDTSGHRWVEVYVPGYGWIPFDPTWDRERHVFPGMAKQTYIGARPMVTLVRNRGGGTSREYLWEVYPTKFSSLNSRQTERSQVAIWSFPDGRGG
jgi:transglutaminase-like putative cysteine protease